MRKVFKYPLAAEFSGSGAHWEERQVIEMPGGAKILSVALQGGRPVLWALVDPEAPKERRPVYIVNTGGELGDEFGGRRFVGTLVFGDGGIVLHVWE